MENNKYQLKIYPLARLDMEQIFNYIAVELCNPTAAIGQINDFEKAFDNICSFPESCPFINNEYVKDKSLRKLVVNNYIAFYRIRDKEIQVVRVLYGMRNYETFL
ncbi:MAG: type II toxin-antitoxin system RelE/ParE family toxin [Clostridia bacterium]|nr:type II toxin-antitoxin system RelE/ParE family toxin [Clostridia bacterium]MBO5224032.1 type II toxin-antitoxin system RelE/ParE family toxin [Clostridia bacterium]MBR2384741.1 type II toxin-antitoxin system RelE/ParE family toxin [Clostridia bacterium]